MKQTNVQWLSTRCSLVLCLCFGEESMGFLLESRMTNLKGHGHSAEQRVPASPHVPGPAEPPLFSFLLPCSWDEGSVLASLLASGQGKLMIAGRKEAGNRNVVPSRHSPFPSTVFELLGILFQGQRSPDVFIPVYLQMWLSAKRCAFFYLGKSLVRFTRRTSEAQELPARTNACNLPSDQACGPDFLPSPPRESRNEFSQWRPGVDPGRGSGWPRARARSWRGRRAGTARLCLCSARQPRAHSTAALLQGLFCLYFTAARWGNELRWPLRWESTHRGWISSLVSPPNAAVLSLPSPFSSFSLFRSCLSTSSPRYLPLIFSLKVLIFVLPAVLTYTQIPHLNANTGTPEHTRDNVSLTLLSLLTEQHVLITIIYKSGQIMPVTY